jgi:predicted nucleotidyltransferase
MSPDDSLISQIAEAITNPEETVGVLIHGSYATGLPYPDSDVDVICLVKSEQRKRYIRSINGISVDLFAASRRHIDKIIHCDVPNNNNLVLYAFVRGRPIIDRNGSIVELIDIAGRVWAEGPAMPGQEERERLRTSSRIACAIAARMKTRSMRSREWGEMAHLHSGMLFYECVHAYCRIHRLWASAIWEMLKWSDARYDFLLAEIRGYLREPSLESRLRTIRHVAEATVTRCSAHT